MNFPAEWATKALSLLQISERLKTAVIESLDASDCIEKYDSPRTLFYVDPPYVEATRTAKKVYSREMMDGDHARLIQTLDGVQGAVVLSGYDCPLYRTLLDGWQKESKPTRNDQNRRTTETLWLKRAEPAK